MAKIQWMGVFKYALGILLGIGLLYLAFKDTDFNALLRKLEQTNYLWVLAAFIPGIFSHWIRGYRWSMLLDAAGHPVNSLHTSASVMVGYMANNAVPRLGEISRCTILLKSDKVPFAVGAGTVFTERAIDLISLILLILGIFFFEFDRVVALLQQFPGLNDLGFLPLLMTLLLAGMLGLILLWLLRKPLLKLGFVQKLVSFVKTLFLAIISIRKLKSPGMFLVASALLWLGYITTTYFVFQALPASEATPQLTYYFAYVVTIIGGIGMTIPIPGGIGSFHGAVKYSFIMFGLSPELGNLVAILIHTPGTIIFNTLVGALAYFYLVFQDPEQKGVPQPATETN